jgi:uncharacterized protein YukE
MSGTTTDTRSGANLLTDVKGTVAAIENGDWLSAAGGIANTALDIIGLSGDPLGAISSAGFGWAVEHISFLREPFDALLGDPGSIRSTAATWSSAGSQLVTTAQQYRETSVQQTSQWTGMAADGYRRVSASHADGLEGLAKAGEGLSAAITGAGQVIAEVRKVVMDLIAKAVQKIIMQIIEALSAAWATFGASIAMAVVRIVQTAVSTAQKLLGRIAKLVQSLQKVFQLVNKVVQLVRSIRDLVRQLSGKAKQEPVRQAQTLPTIEIPDYGPPPRTGCPASRVEIAQWIDKAVNVLVDRGVDPTRMNPEQVAAIIQRESGGNPYAVTTGKGLMRLSDHDFHTHKLDGHDDIYPGRQPHRRPAPTPHPRDPRLKVALVRLSHTRATFSSRSPAYQNATTH